MRRITWLLALILTAGVLVAAGCGGDDSSGGSSGSSGTSSGSSSSSSGGGPLTVTADPGGAISWDKSALSAKAGKVTLKLVNDSQTPHAIEVEGNGVEKKTDNVTGGTADLTVDLKPGKYEFYCPVPGHKATMHGTLTVS
jgi:plastocyanin